MKYLFIAEKPSLMRDVKNCYEKHQAEIMSKVGEIEFLALSGHVCRNAEPDEYEIFSGPWYQVQYPMIPTEWKICAIKDTRKRQILQKIKVTASSYDGIIVGTDSDVEGYGIYYLLETFLHLEKKLALRFVEHSLTDNEILKSLLHMTDYHKDPVHQRNVQSFLLRSQADWLYGMNCTRMLTVKTKKLMTIGRVKAPTIQLVYDNSMSIEQFKPQTYYQRIADYGSFQGVQINETGVPVNFLKKEELSIPTEGEILSIDKETIKKCPMQLYDLSALQAEAGQMFGMTPAEVLETVQSLYEVHKIISYPRTQCRYVSVEKSLEFQAMLQQSSVFPSIAPFLQQITEEDIRRVKKNKRVVNDAEVEKESHDALLPTSKKPKLEMLSEKELKICELIYKRLVSQFLPLMEECKTKMVIQHGNVNFLARGRIITNHGWRELYGTLEDNQLPDLQKGSMVHASRIGLVKKETTPPKRLTQATLLVAMKNIANTIEDKELRKSLADSQGIGTPATRDAIITDIIRRGYVKDMGKGGLYITAEGKEYVEQMQGLSISSPVFAATLDTNIKRIQRGEASFENSYRDMLMNLRAVCNQIAQKQEGNLQDVVCPKCGQDMQQQQYQYTCSHCGLEINKYICGVQIKEDLLQELRERGHTRKLTFTKKDKTKFTGRLKLNGNKLEFDFSSGLLCPSCKKELRVNRGGCFCDCGLKLFRNICGRTLTDRELKKLLAGETLPPTDYTSKSGELFSAGLKLENDKLSFVFED